MLQVLYRLVNPMPPGKIPVSRSKKIHHHVAYAEKFG
jgi:hypothetical protein